MDNNDFDVLEYLGIDIKELPDPEQTRVDMEKTMMNYIIDSMVEELSENEIKKIEQVLDKTTDPSDGFMALFNLNEEMPSKLNKYMTKFKKLFDDNMKI